VNQGDGKGRSKANVVALRAVFIDDDGKAASVAFQSDGVEPFAALAPTITVQSKAGQPLWAHAGPSGPARQQAAGV
jgi:hypothetical protein